MIKKMLYVGLLSTMVGCHTAEENAILEKAWAEEGMRRTEKSLEVVHPDGHPEITCVRCAGFTEVSISCFPTPKDK